MARRNHREVRRPEDWFSPVRLVEHFETVHELGTVEITLGPTTFLVIVDASGGNEVVDLPEAGTVPNRILNVKKIDSSANTVTVTAFAGDTIDGLATLVLSEQWESVMMVCDGTASWYVLSWVQNSFLLE